MRVLATRLVLAAVLLAAGEAVRRAATIEEGLAATEARLVTRPERVTPADYDAVEEQLGLAARLPVIGARIRRDLRLHRALAAYWNGDYAAVASVAGTGETSDEETGDAADAELLLVSANASFRDTIRAGRPRADLLRSLDDALRRYGDVLDAAPGHEGAAYNYEFANRLRTALARGQRPDQLLPEEQPNMHGDEGEPPQGTTPAEFNVIVPMRPDERQEQFDAGEGGVPQRKG